MVQKFDAMIIGFGKGGKTLAGHLANQGQKVVLVEKSSKMYGGTCINVACIPTKSLENDSSQIRRESIERFDVQREKYAESVEKKNTLITALRKANFDKLNNHPNVTVLTGMASFVDEYTVDVELVDGGVETLKADKIYINTGAKPSMPPIKGLAESRFVYSNETLMELKELPQEFVIIGGGFIGLEFASIYSGFGSKVTVLNAGSQILRGEDADDVEAVMELFVKKGIKILNNVKVLEVTDADANTTVVYEDISGIHEVNANGVLVATGRVANVEGLQVEKAGIELTERGFIKVNDKLQTTKPHIYVLGDVNGGPQFTYISLDDYRVIVNENRTTGDRKNVPSALFIDPTYASVGMNVTQAKEAGYEVLVAKMPVMMIPRAKQIGRTDGFLKVIIDKNTEHILGARFLAEEGSELIHMIQLAIQTKISYTQLRDNIYAHPTMIEAFNELFSSAMIKEA